MTTYRTPIAWLIFLTLFLLSGLLLQKAFSVELSKGNFTALIGEVNYNSTTKILEDIKKSDPSKPFYLYIYSPGGDILTSFPLLQQLPKYKHVHCISEIGISMAFAITQACPVRLVLPTSILMQHQAGGQFSGKTSELKTSTLLIEKLQNMLNILDAKRLGIELSLFISKIKDEWWMVGAADILANKAADAVTDISCDRELDKSGECPIGKLN